MLSVSAGIVGIHSTAKTHAGDCRERVGTGGGEGTNYGKREKERRRGGERERELTKN